MLGGLVRAERRQELERRQGVQKPGGWPGENGSRRGSLACGGAKCTQRVAEMPGTGESRKQTAAGWAPAAPGPRLCRRHCGVGAWIQPASRHLVLLVSDAQDEVVQGAAKDGVGAVVE